MIIKNRKINTVAVLYGGLSGERDISLLTGKVVINALVEERFNVVPIDVKNRNFIKILQTKKIDFVYIALHGPFGEDGTVQGMLELMQLPYSGSEVLASALAMNKIYSKQIFEQQKIPTPQWITTNTMGYNNKQLNKLGYPLVIKPASQGSAIGVNIVSDRKSLNKAITEAKRYDSQILVEKYIPGREVTVGILGNEALPVIEIIPKQSFYNYEAKYLPGGSKHIVPARLPKKLSDQLKKLALQTHFSLGCRAVSRVDFRVDNNKQAWVLEINTIPGMTKVSLLPEAARAIGISFNQLVLKIIEYSL